MSKEVLETLGAHFGDRILETSSFRGDDEAVVAPKDWREVASFLRNDCAMNHFVMLSAIDRPERKELPRFDVVLIVRSLETKRRVRLRTRVGDGESLDSLVEVWAGCDWEERETYDMFGIKFADHPDLRRILMYDEFEGYPLRKDYPIDKTQPLVEYRDVGPAKLAPFRDDMGQPFNRIDWLSKARGRNLQVSPALALQQGQRDALSSGTATTETKGED